MRFDCFTLQSAALPDFWLSSIIACCLRRSREPIGSAVCPRCYVRFAWFASDLVGGGDPITQRALAVAPAGRGASRFPVSLRARRSIIRRWNPGRAVCPFAGIGRSIRAAFGRSLQSPASKSGCSARGLCRRRDGRSFHRGRASSRDRDRARHRNDGERHNPVADAELSACCVAMLVLTLLGDPPIYELLRKRPLHMNAAPRSSS